MENSVGDLTLAELRQYESLRSQQSAIRTRIGALEVEKAHLVGHAMDLDRAFQDMLVQIAQRIGIPADCPWSIDAQGSVVVSQGAT